MRPATLAWALLYTGCVAASATVGWQCADPVPTHYGHLCSEPHGYSTDGPPEVVDGVMRVRLSLSPAFSAADLAGMREGCRRWGLLIPLDCEAEIDSDWQPARHAVPVHRCYGPRRAEGSTAVTYSDSRGTPEIVVNGNAPLTPYLAAHELGHVLRAPDVPCTPETRGTQVMVTYQSCAADAPTEVDEAVVRARWP